ncbi:MAG: phosphoadenosine phosphosulfate reductase [Spirochaetes bacterium RBG_16_49_21]|nr:MAG: phosphoadenosine phosphosulfate reductase [Spirochaetes bacterium RBG_16_49_21]
MEKNTINTLIREFTDKSAEEILKYFISRYKSRGDSAARENEMERIALGTALGAEGQALTHMIVTIHPKARIFVIDTGRLHEETYDLMMRSMNRYGIRYEIYFPEASDVEELERMNGPNLFYENADLRKKCCHVRKVKPLRRVLQTLDVWITGLRRSQSVTRSSIEKIEWDEANGLIKLNPLADWSEEDVWRYIRENNIPYNKLHDQGYPSIGCAPCTRAVSPGEDIRAGRWWWEQPEHRECGLHPAGGRLVGRNNRHG